MELVGVKRRRRRRKLENRIVSINRILDEKAEEILQFPIEGEGEREGVEKKGTNEIGARKRRGIPERGSLARSKSLYDHLVPKSTPRLAIARR